ncbi:MAG: uridine kinase [Paucimonas sp.]|nr:uridine kinase [Paucimonas sp.]
MKKLFSHPLFLAGLALKLFLIAMHLPRPAAAWFLPFLDVSTSHFVLDPWRAWLEQGGTPVSFPYGYVMWLAFLPLTWLCKLTGIPLMFAYGGTLLAADIGLLAVLRSLLPKREKLLLSVYWLSPIVLLATYGFGLNDLIPVLLLSLSVYFARRLKLAAAGALCIAAVSAKLSMVLALPFFFIYLIRNRALRQLLPDFAKGLVAAFMLFIVPFVLSKSGLYMVFSNPELGKVYEFALGIGGALAIYIVPLAYMIMLYLAWRVRRLNFDLFHAILGMAFLLVALLTPASPGWFIWALPLLVTYQAKSGRIAIALVGAFSALFVVAALAAIPTISILEESYLRLPWHLDAHATSLLHTAMIAVGIVLAMRIWRETVSLNDYFRLSRKPFVIGIAGDSGAGKDTLADALKGLFGGHSVAHLSGDDYHLWDRHKPMWQVMTHLNPMANDIEGFANDLLALRDGRTIRPRHYDHSTGKMSHPHELKSNDFIIASSLHALYLPILRKCYNLSIYLDIDEDLRRCFKLQRDVHQRGHTREKVLASMEKREPDSVRYVRPQAAHADLIISLQPINRAALNLNGEIAKEPPRAKLFVRSRNGLNEISLMRVLIGVCGLHVDMNLNGDATEVDLVIEGETSATDVAMAASMLFPHMLEFLDVAPAWKDGVLGLMQLITLAHVNQALNRRLI